MVALKLSMVEVFKTNVKRRKMVEQLILILRNQFAFSKINLDLQDCDKILRLKASRFAWKPSLQY